MKNFFTVILPSVLLVWVLMAIVIGIVLCLALFTASVIAWEWLFTGDVMVVVFRAAIALGVIFGSAMMIYDRHGFMEAIDDED